jgi:hypothetical protein
VGACLGCVFWVGCWVWPQLVCLICTAMKCCYLQLVALCAADHAVGLHALEHCRLLCGNCRFMRCTALPVVVCYAYRQHAACESATQHAHHSMHDFFRQKTSCFNNAKPCIVLCTCAL